jgi:hypothetical protein
MTGSRLVAALLVITFAFQTTVLAAGLSWGDLQNVRPGTELRVKDHGDRVFVAVDESALYLLNLLNPQLPRNVKSSLKEWVKEHPDTLPALKRGATVTGLAHNVRIGSEGLFVGDQKIAELSAVFQTLPRTELSQDAIAIKQSKKLSWGAKAAIIGGIVAGVVVIQWIACLSDGTCAS